MTDQFNNNTTYKNNENDKMNKNEDESFPLENVGQAGMVGPNPEVWPTIVETKTLRSKRTPKLMGEGSRRTAPYKRRGITPYKKGDQITTLVKNKTPKVVIKRVEDYEGFVTVVPRRRNGRTVEVPPGTCGEAETGPIPTGAELPGTIGLVKATPIPTGDTVELPGTSGTDSTVPFPTGEVTGKEGGGNELPSTSSHAPPLARDGGGIGIEEEEDDETVIMSMDEEEEPGTVKKKPPGRPITTGKGVGLRQKKEEEAKAREERESEARIQRVMDPTIPAGKRWEIFRNREEELRQELSMAPTMDLQARVMEDTAKIFKAADCASKMKGGMVRILKEAAATMRASLLVMADRVKKIERATGPSKRERYLEQQVAELKKRVEEVERSRSTPPRETPTLIQDRKVAIKRRKVIIDSDEDMPALSNSHIASPPLPQVKEIAQEGKGETKASRYCPGPSIQGKTRWVEAHPSEVRPRDWASFDALAKQRAQLAGIQSALSLEPAKYKEYAKVGAQIAAVAARMNALKVGEERDRSRDMPHTAPNQKGKGDKPPPTRKEEEMEGVEVTSPPVQNNTAAQGKKKKKKKKKKRRSGEGVGNSAPAGDETLQAKEGGNEPVRLTPPQSLSRPIRVSQRPAPGGKKTSPLANTTGEKHLPLAKREGETYSSVVGRKAKIKGKAGGEKVQGTPSPNAKPKRPDGGKNPNQAQPRPSSSSSPLSPSQGGMRKKGKRKAPRTAAVVITCPPGGYKEIMREAVEKIDLASLNIGGMTTRKAVTGAQIYEIGGPDKEKKADALASRLRELVERREGVRISRPTAMAELRIRGLDESIEPADIIGAVARNGGCSPADVKAGEVQATGRGPGTAWIRCPVAAANKIVAAGAIQVGWVKARVEALERRPLQCFRCLKKGHTIAQCSGPDRSNLCYRCGGSGHTARECRRPEHCPVCADLGRAAAHRAGTRMCASPKSGKGKRGRGAKPPAPPPAQNLSQKERDEGPKEERVPPSSAPEGGETEGPKPQRIRRERENPLPQQPPEAGAADRMDTD